jgi:hypothetical protein
VPQALLAQAVVAGQHEGVQTQPVAQGTGEVVYQVTAHLSSLHFLYLSVTAAQAQGNLGAERSKQRLQQSSSSALFIYFSPQSLTSGPSGLMRIWDLARVAWLLSLTPLSFTW